MNFLSKLFKTKKVEDKFNYSENENVIFNVDNFNEWFNEPNNGAVYANSGIFLRIDKLGESHVEDYLLKKYNLVNGSFLFSKPYREMISDFKRDIITDWQNKLKTK